MMSVKILLLYSIVVTMGCSGISIIEEDRLVNDRQKRGALEGQLLKKKDNRGCPEIFEGKCICKFQNFPVHTNTQQYVVNCTQTRFTDASVLEELPLETNVLIFTGNLLDNLTDNIFEFDIDRDQLKYIDLSNNHITFIGGQSFHKVHSVETLILNFNKLEISDDFERRRLLSNFENLKFLHLTDAFTDRYNASAHYIHNLEHIFMGSKLENLQILHMEQNEIVSIGENASIFCPLKNLEQLYLSDNKLFDMEFRVNCLKKLNHIDMRYNMITRLSDSSMNRLNNFVGTGWPLSVNLRNNPLSCDCRSVKFLDWVSSSGVQLDQVESYTCLDGFPPENIGKKIIEISDMECEEMISITSVGYPSSTVGLLSFLIVFMSVLVLLLGIYHKKRLAKVIQPLVDDITRQMGYKGLANEEQPHEAHV